MAQIKDLLVAGKSRFVGTTSFNDQMISLGGMRFLEGSLEKKSVIYQVLGIDSSGVAVYADMTGLTIGTANKLSVSGGGTMQPVYFASGQPVTLPAFKNNTAVGPLGWVSTSQDIMAITSNTLAYWNGAHSGTSSNISVLGKISAGTWQATPIGAAYGGTGQNTLAKSANVLINALSTQTTTPVDADYYISQSANGGTTTTTYYRRPMSSLWTYIKGKSDNTYVNVSGDTMSGSLNINGNNGTTGLIIRRNSIDTESLKITIDDSNATFHYTNDERANQFKFVLYNTDTEAPASTGAVPNTSTITMAGSSAGSVVTATQFVGALTGNATTATTASKLGTNAGSSTLPVYFASGIPVACSTTLGVSITGNAATATVANKISDLASTDKASSTATQRYVWFSYDNNTTGRPAYSSSFTYQTSTGTLTATKFKGELEGNAATATTASKLGTNAGSATRPVYFASGIPVQCNETLAVNISKNAATATMADAAKRLDYVDTRSENPTPGEMTKGLTIHLKSNNADGLSDGGSYHVALHMRNWNDISGGPWSQMATTGNGHLWYRVSTDNDTWGTWYKAAVQNKANTFSANNTFSGSNIFSGPTEFTGAVTIGGMKNGYCHEWTASVKCATWSRLCYVAYAHNVTGSAYILNIAGTRNSVVYNDTYLVKTHHSSNGTLIKLGGHKYSMGYKVRLLANSSGHSYIELYDNCQSATSSTTQSVYCRLIPIYAGAVTKYTSFTDGTTVPTDFTVVKTLTLNNADIQADVSGKNNIYYVTGNSTGTAGQWTGTNTQIPGLYTGLTIAYKIQIAGHADGVTLNLTTAEGASGAKTVRRNDSSLTTHLPAGSVVVLIYDGTYWRWADYDANSYAKTRQYSTATDANYPLIFRYTNNTVTSGSYVSEYSRFDSDNLIYANPSSGALGAVRLLIKGSNPYVGFQNSSGTMQGYIQYIESTDSFAIGTSNADSLQVTAAGSISIPASQTFTPRTTNTGSVGTSSLKWNAMYATTFYGALEGNAKTATNATNATTASKLGTGAAGDTSTPVYFTSGGTPTKLTATVGGVAKPVYLNAGTITACSSTVGSTTKPVYMNAGTITVSNATVGSASRPMYLNAGTMTAITAVGIAYGGTGATSQTANRVIYTNTDKNLVSSGHFSSSVKMAINSTSEPATTFHVEGSANVDGELSLDSKVKFVYNSTDESLDFIFV